MEKILKADVPLLTLTGKVIVPIKIVYDDNEVISNPKSEIFLLYNGIEYRGIGNDYL